MTRKVHRSRDGRFEYHPDLDILKLAVVERHHATGNIGLGLVENYRLQGGIASTIAHDSHNIIVIGDNDEDMFSAVSELIRVNGGITICSRGGYWRLLNFRLQALCLTVPLMKSTKRLKRCTGRHLRFLE